MSAISPLEALLKRDRAIVIVSLVAITALCWLYLVDMARDMSGMDMGGMDSAAMPMDGTDAETMDADTMNAESSDRPGMDMEGSSMKTLGGAMEMTQIAAWTPGYFTMMFLMWAIMMVGMMVPSAAPMVLVYASFVRKRENASPYLSTGAFLSGYLLVWTAFSLAATTLQWGLDAAALLSPMMVSTSPLLGAGLLIGAGVFQITPWKNACLAHCRSPIQFFMTHWRKGKVGALRMGMEHGTFCLGCCWLLMGLLFFGGVMNLIWIAAITLFVLLEKVAPLGPHAGKVTGALMIASGVGVVALG